MATSLFSESAGSLCVMETNGRRRDRRRFNDNDARQSLGMAGMAGMANGEDGEDGEGEGGTAMTTNGGRGDQGRLVAFWTFLFRPQAQAGDKETVAVAVAVSFSSWPYAGRRPRYITTILQHALWL